MRTPRAFSLAELLVVIGVVALLLAILLPVLSAARRAARSTQCLGNLRQMQVGWVLAMESNAGVIPQTHIPLPASEPVWYDELVRVIPGPRLIDELRLDRVCPELASLHPDATYQAQYFGYGVNTRWEAGLGPGANEDRNWQDIRRNASYLWFACPAVVNTPPTVSALNRVGVSAGFDGRWQLGDYHGGAANASFADGHASPINLADETLDADGTPRLFHAR